MRATMDLPDALYRQVEAHAAIHGRTVRDVTIELYERWLGEQRARGPYDAVPSADEWLARWDEIGVEVARRNTRAILDADRR